MPKKRKSTVISSQTYKTMVEEVITESPTKALDLHGIYEALAEKYDQYRADNLDVDWRNSIRHCLSINDNFIRVLPEALKNSFFITQLDHPIFYRVIGNEKVYARSFWTVAEVVQELNWFDYILKTDSNMKKAVNISLLTNEDAQMKLLESSQKTRKRSLTNSVIDTFIITETAISAAPVAKRVSITERLINEWIDPSSFVEVNHDGGSISATNSPTALEAGNRSALFNIAVIDEDERIKIMRHRLRTLKQTLPNAFGPIKVDFIDILKEKEPAKLPCPFKEENQKDSVNSVTLPPIFNHQL